VQLWWRFVVQINRLLKYFSQSQHEPKPKDPSVPTTALEERQELLAHHVRLVARKMANGLFVYGSKGGLGKTKTILRTLAEEGIRPVILNGHCTPMALYEVLCRSEKDALILIDDADSLYRNLAALGILRSALWGETNEKRLVTYNSTQSELPQSFYFNGRIIFVANVIPRKNAAFEAVLSRVDVFELDATNEQAIELMRKIAIDGFEGLTATECLQVVNFIAEFASTRELSLRLLEPSFRKMIYAKEANIDWRELVRTQLEQIGQDEAPKPADNKEFDLIALEQAVLAHPNSVGEQQDLWCRTTGKSRASFFRLKKSFDDRKADDRNKKPDQPPSDSN
jgi:hypothetical protein